MLEKYIPCLPAGRRDSVVGSKALAVERVEVSKPQGEARRRQMRRVGAFGATPEEQLTFMSVNCKC